MSAFTPIGFSPLQAALCGRAASFEPQTTPFVDKRGQAIGVCRVGGLGSATGYDRMLALAVGALRAGIDGASLGETAMALALPEAGRPDDDARFATSFAFELAERAGLRLDRDRVAVVRADRAGVAHAAERALEWLDAGTARVVVGGVDSYHHPDVLAWLDEEYRLHAVGAEDGFVPGEAAAFFVLERGGDEALPRLTRALTGDDPGGREGPPDQVPADRAETMTQLLRAVGPPPPWIVQDENGERHRNRWWRLASMRDTVARGATIDRVAPMMGDVGAATGAVAVAMVHALWSVGAAPASRCVVALHGEAGERGVLALEEGGT